MPGPFLLFLALSTACLLPFSAIAALLLLIGIAANRQSRGVDWLQPMAWLMLGWLVWLPLSLTWSLSPGYAQTQLAVLLCLPLAWLAGSQLQTDRRLARLLDWALPVLLALLVIWGILQGSSTYTGKPQGPFNDPNAYAAVLNLLMLPLLARWLSIDPTGQSWRQRSVVPVLLGGGLFVSFLVSSRGAALALGMVTPFLLWKSRQTPEWRRKWGLLALTVIAAYMTAWMSSGGMNLVTRLADTVKAGDQPRWLLLRASWAMILDHPWLGTGLGSFRLLYPRYRLPGETVSAGGWVHDDYLQLWTEAGLPMLLLLLGVAIWVARQAWRTLRERSPAALERLGYLAAVVAVLIHATVNFLFYFTPVALLVGLYLARAEEPPDDSRLRLKHAERWGLGLSATVYGLMLAYLYLYLVASELLLGQAAAVQRQLWRWHITYPRFEVAKKLSLLDPYDATPQQTMGQELALSLPLAHDQDARLRAALGHMQTAQRLLPCYQPYTDTALALLTSRRLDDDLLAQGWRFVRVGLECGPRHGLFYWHAGRLAEQRPGDGAMPWWRAGLAASYSLGERLLLASAILSREYPEHKAELARLTEQIADNLRAMESNPGVQADRVFWTTTQHTLQRLCGERYFKLVPPPR